MRAKAWNCSLRATKSVSLLTSTTAPLVPKAATATKPSEATRLAFFAASAKPLVRSQSTADWISPSVSVKAFLQSIMPAPVLPRSSLTMAAEIGVTVNLLYEIYSVYNLFYDVFFAEDVSLGAAWETSASGPATASSTAPASSAGNSSAAPRSSPSSWRSFCRPAITAWEIKSK